MIMIMFILSSQNFLIILINFIDNREEVVASFYKRGKMDFEKLHLAGTWDEYRTNHVSRNVFQNSHLRNLYGKNLLATSFEYKPYTYSINNKVNGESSYDGVEVRYQSKIR